MVSHARKYRIKKSDYNFSKRLSDFWKFFTHFTLSAGFWLLTAKREGKTHQIPLLPQSSGQRQLQSLHFLMHMRSWTPGRGRAACGTQTQWKDNAVRVCMWEQCCTLSSGFSVSTTSSGGSRAGYQAPRRLTALWEVGHPSHSQLGAQSANLHA